MNRKKLFILIKTILLIVLIMPQNDPVIAQDENLNILDRWIEWSDGKNMLIHHLNDRAFDLLDKRDEEIDGLKTKKNWIERQKKVKDILMNIVGPFPEKTPLNAKVTGIVQKDGFRIEKIIYESMPGLYVTACLFIPDRTIKSRPAIIHVSGHSFSAFRSESNQRYIYNLVKKGFIVFAIDPLGQGERVQYWDSTRNASEMGSSPTREHSYFGNQMFISGISPIRYFIWDGIRGVDYLFTREEVDTERIGIFGCSGGGTQTTFISAFDERIKAAVPGCYITGYRRLLESIGPQDAEQNVYHGILNGITHADLLELRAPKPLLISSTTRDFFSIQGAVETYREIKKAYKAFGKEENAGQVIDDAGHGFHKTITDVYAFFQKVFHLPGSSVEEPFDGFKPEDLQVTETGQLSTSAGGKLAFDINKEESQVLLQKLDNSRKNITEHLNDIPQKAAELSGFIPPSEKTEPAFRGRYQRDGYSVEMYALHGEGEYVVPLLLFIPKTGNKFPCMIYMHPEGKIADAAPGGKIEQLVKKGYIVAAPDVLGIGETEDASYGSFYLSLMTGRSIVGIQAGDVIRVVNFLKSWTDIDHNKINAVAFDEMGITLLYAAAFDNSIRYITLISPLISYRSVVMNKYYDTGLSKYFVAGALTGYDLPDLAASLTPRELKLVNITDSKRELIDPEEDNDIIIIKAAYTENNAQDMLKIISKTAQGELF